MLIHPARFLFDAGSTPKAWNREILNNQNFNILEYRQKSNDIFSNTDIKGGVAISYYDTTKIIGSIKVFTPYRELKTIMNKVDTNANLTEIIYTQNSFDLQQLYNDYPEFKKTIGT